MRLRRVLRQRPILVAIAVGLAASWILASAPPPSADAAEPPSELLGPDSFGAHHVPAGPGVLLTWSVQQQDPTHYFVVSRGPAGCPFEVHPFGLPGSIVVTLTSNTSSYVDTDVAWRRSYIYHFSVVDPETGRSTSSRAAGISLAPPSDWVHRFRNKATGTPLYTLDESEREYVVTHLGAWYEYEGPAFQSMYPDEHAIPVYRFFSPNAGVHFYTADPRERDDLIARFADVYAYEGVCFSVLGYPPFLPFAFSDEFAFGPVWRFFDPKRGVHILPVDYEIYAVPAPYWRLEGQAFFAPR